MIFLSTVSLLVWLLCPLLVWYCLHLCPVPEPFWLFWLHAVAFQSGLFFSAVFWGFSFNIFSAFLVISYISKVKEFSLKHFQHISPHYPLPKSTYQILYFSNFFLFWHTTRSQNEVTFRIEPRCPFDNKDCQVCCMFCYKYISFLMQNSSHRDVDTLDIKLNLQVLN